MRRSMADLGALLTGSAVVETLPARRPVATASLTPAAAPNDHRNERAGRESNGAVDRQDGGAYGAEPGGPVPDQRDGTGVEEERAAQQLDEVTLAAARSAEDYRSWMLENVKVHIIAAVDHQTRFANANLPPDFTDQGSGRTGERETAGAALDRRQPLVPIDAGERYRARTLQLLNSQVNATLNYAWRLAAVRSPAEFIELSTSHTCRSFELFMKHAAELTILTRSLPPTTRQTDEQTPG
jgi:hypothetical protein